MMPITNFLPENMDFSKLEYICNADPAEFSKYGELVHLNLLRNNERYYYFKDNGANVLAVAHLDTVAQQRFCRIQNRDVGRGKRALCAASPALDDRLGAYTILELLPSLGCDFDILLTTDEECGASTASDFFPSRHGFDGARYNWMFQFDRAGMDAVMYQYRTPVLTQALRDAGIEAGYGSYSDISSLDHIGCAGINFGVAYRDYHSDNAHVQMSEYFNCIRQFLRFYDANRETRFEFIAPDWQEEVLGWVGDYPEPSSQGAREFTDEKLRRDFFLSDYRYKQSQMDTLCDADFWRVIQMIQEDREAQQGAAHVNSEPYKGKG